MQSRDFPLVPRQYDALQNGLRDVQFSRDPGNRLSVQKIRSGVDVCGTYPNMEKRPTLTDGFRQFLASTKFQGQPAVRHLIVVAASTPRDDAIGVNPYANECSPWQSLAQTLAQVYSFLSLHVMSQSLMRFTGGNTVSYSLGCQRRYGSTNDIV
jgi:hypothetical protein